ncbi:cupin domain-containing protein [Candidatus Enterococcus mansonii]|uniref:Cupin 2 conserved barrel domain-containing protein n=1 Tax=Candidatus Enterococcus mansonii TaxID=1834181 RepID=A0A242CI56_9ENTE|nr:cupin domain-containing protein [Enterococcus sp. 4G2_DIV0659]OTO09924.1 hypothetical protein A5880_000607 [Enterococcus sp. 4G2_DIV0659]
MDASHKSKKHQPNIVKQTEAISIKKANGTEVDYYLFDAFEIHTNVIPAGCVQDWHVHKKIEEIIVINKGCILLEWLETDIIKEEVRSGEIIRMNSSIHRISNKGESEAICTIFRFVSPIEDQSEVIKNDKKSYSSEEIKQKILANKTIL